MISLKTNIWTILLNPTYQTLICRIYILILIVMKWLLKYVQMLTNAYSNHHMKLEIIHDSSKYLHFMH